jgi:ABC-type oligopeptide transport system substrate-binding subunit
MVRRVWFSLALVLLGAAMLATAQLAAAEGGFGFRQGGVFRVGFSGASVQVDPQIAYVTTAWWMEYATAAKLVNYQDLAGEPGTRLVPEVASRYTVSRDGRTWTFFIRKGFRFSDGLPVTAASFKLAIDRVANHDLASPGAPFITDPKGATIVGAREVADGRSQHVRGVVAKGNRLVIHLARRDPAFISKLAMPFFQATSARLPLNREVTGAYPSAGPYFFSRNVPNALTQLRRNPYYRGARTHNLRGVDVRWNLPEESGYQQVQSGSLDEGPLPAAHVREVAKAYGVNRSRFWRKPMSCLSFLAINDDRPLFRNNVALRRALSWSVNRKAYARAAGPYAVTPWSHLLPPTSPASLTAQKLQPYRGAPNLRKARSLSAGHLRRGRINIGYRSTGSMGGAAQARLLRADLVKLGIDPARIRLKAFSGADIYDVMGKRGTDLDLGVGMGWCADASPMDPASLVRQALESSSLFGIGSVKYARRLQAALRLKGEAQYRALGKLDVDLTKDLAPTVVLGVYNNRYLFSSRVDRRSLVYQNVYTDWSIPALALK